MFDSVVDGMLPGPELAGVLAGADLSTLSADRKLAAAAGYKRLAAWAEAGMLAAVASFAAGRDTVPAGRGVQERWGGVRMVRLGGDGTPVVEEFAAEEVAVALRLAPGTARALVGHALDLTNRFPAVHAALSRGDTDGFRARLVTDTTRDLDTQAATRVEQAVLPRLARVTTGQLEKLVTAETIAADPQRAAAELEVASGFKGVWPAAGAHPGLAGMSAELDAAAMRRLEQRITGVAGLLRRSGRTEDWQQLRADALGMLADPASIETLRTRIPPAPPARPDDGPQPGASTGGATDAGGDAGGGGGGCAGGWGLPRTVLYLHADPSGRYELEGHGPVTTGQARRILADSQVLVKPVIDLNTDLCSDRYQVPEATKETVRVRDRSCRFPGCPRAARRCQCDHQIPWPHGPTTPANLCCLCTRHHRMKTHGRWQLRQPFPGILVWRSPTGAISIVDQRGTTHLGQPHTTPTSRSG